MSTPEDAPKAIQEFTWIFNVKGEDIEIVTNGSYPNVDGEYVSVESKVIEEGYQPPIYDFSIETEDEDLTEYFLSEENLIVIVSYSLETIESGGVERLKKMSEEAMRNGYKIIGLTASGEETKQRINDAYDLNFDWYLCDEKALKTVVRSNPGILELDNGTVKQKLHWNDIDNLELPKVERKPEPVKEVDPVLYLIDDKISSKEEMDAIDSNSIEEVYVLKERSQGDILDSINTANNTSYTAYVKVVLKKE
jgi:hypothetical protein